MKRLAICFVFLFALIGQASAAGCAGTGACFWEGGTGNSSDTTKWCTTDTNPCTGTTGSIPTQTDNCNFTANSNPTAYTFTINATINCKDITWALPLVSGVPTWVNNASTGVFGNITLVAGMLTSGTLNIYPQGSGTRNITTNGVIINFGINCVDATPTTVLLQDNLSMGSAYTLNVTGGIFNTNAKTVTAGSLTSTSGTRTLTLDNSTINITGTSGTPWNVTTTGSLTQTMTGSTVNFTGGAAGTALTITQPAANAFATLSITGAGLWTLGQATTASTFSYTSTTNKTDQLALSGNLIVTGTATLAGNSSVNRAFVLSSVLGTQRTITGGIILASNIDFQDVAVAGSNYALRSQTFSNSTWTKTQLSVGASTTGPDGLSSAVHLTESAATSSHNTAQIATVTAGVPYTGTFILAAAERTQAGLQLFDGASVNQYPIVNLTTGAVVSANGATVTSRQLPNGFWAFSFTVTPGTTSLSIYFYIAVGGNTSYAGDGTSGINVFAVNLDQNSSIRTYMPTTTAAVTALDLSAITGGAGDALGNSGITFTTSAAQTENATGSVNWSTLATWQATNLILQSNNYPVTWTQYHASLGSLVLGPDNLISAQTVIEDNQAGFVHQYYQGPVTVTSGVPYTLSVYVSSASSRRYLNLHVNDNATNNNAASVLVDLQTGSITGAATAYGTFSSASAAVASAANSFWRISLTFTPSVTAMSVKAQLSDGAARDATGNSLYAGNGTSSQYQYGMQLELGDHATTYIPTTTTAVTVGRVPLPQDDVVINYSGASATTLTADMPRLGRNIDFTGYTKTFTLGTANTLFGNLTMSSGMTLSGGATNLSLQGRGAQTFTSSGKGFSSLSIVAFGGSYTLQDNFTANGNPTFQAGTFYANGFNVTCNQTVTFTGGTLNMGTGTWFLTGANNSVIWNYVSGTINANTSTINFSSTAAALTMWGGGKTYNNLYWSNTTSTGILTVTGANTFADFKIDGTTARTVTFPSSTVTTVNTLTQSNVTPGQITTINSSTPGTQATLQSRGPKISLDYVNVQDINATGGAGFYAGNHSTTGYQPSVDLDFANGLYAGDTLANSISVSRAQTGAGIATTSYATNADGSLTSFAANTPRIGIGTGLLVEQASTNLVLQSQALGNAAWATTNTSITPNSIAAPDGTVTGSTFTDTATNSAHRVLPAAAITTVNGSTYTISSYVKNSNLRYVCLTYGSYSVAGAWVSATFDLQAGVTGEHVQGLSGTATFLGWSITPLVNGWYRLSLTASTTATDMIPEFSGAPALTGNTYASNNGIISYAGSGSSAYFWGAQLEALAFPTSYIPTTTTAMTRNADDVIAAGAALTSTQSATGSALVKTSNLLDYTAFHGILASTVNRRILYQGATNNQAKSYEGTTVLTATLGSGTWTGGVVAAATGWSSTGRSTVANNGTVATDANTLGSSGVSTHVGQDATTTDVLNGYIQRMTIWPTRLPDASLNSFTNITPAVSGWGSTGNSYGFQFHPPAPPALVLKRWKKADNDNYAVTSMAA